MRAEPGRPTVVLGVSGGIAAYKAVEVCRRLVDAGVHVAPVLTAGGHPVRRGGHVLGAGLRAGAGQPVGRGVAHPAHPPRPAGRPGRGRPGHRRPAGPLRGRAGQRPADRHAARHPGAGARVPGHAHRDVGAPGRAGEPGHAPAAGRRRGAARRGPAGRRRRRRGPAGRPGGHRRSGAGAALGRRTGPAGGRPAT